MREKVTEVRLRVGQNIKQLRGLRGWSQEELAEEIGITDKHLGQLERGKVNIGLDLLTRVAEAFDVPVTELLRTASDDSGSSPSAITRRDYVRIGEAIRILERVRRMRARAVRSK